MIDYLPYLAVLIVLFALLQDAGDDDDDLGPGMMVPSYNPTQ